MKTVRTAAASSPLRLTRRGRMVAAGVSALLVGALSMALATTAQAARGESVPAKGAAATGKYITRVTVRPGDTLWALAETYDPNADPRSVVQQVLQLNSLTGYQVQPGEVLWMPRG